MAFNKGELILDKVRSLTTHDLGTGELLMRLTSLEDPSLSTTAEGEEVVDAIGSLITTLYRAKKASFSASNSLVSIDLMAAQYGTRKEVAGVTEGVEKIVVPTCEIVTAKEGKLELKHVPVNEIGYIYSIAEGEIAQTYKSGSVATAAKIEPEFTVDSASKTITLPEGAKDKFYVEYEYETENAMRVVNSTENFPEACMVKIYAYFKDKCNENLTYSGVIVCPKAKLNPESIELALTATGKHPFEFTMLKDYCDDDAELFSVIIAE